MSEGDLYWLVYWDGHEHYVGLIDSQHHHWASAVSHIRLSRVNDTPCSVAVVHRSPLDLLVSVWRCVPPSPKRGLRAQASRLSSLDRSVSGSVFPAHFKRLWEGEMGRLDYWESYILRSLISGLILCVLFFVIYGGYISAPSEDLMSTMQTWITENSVRGWIFSDVMNLLLIWPIMWRRWRDLGSKLKKGWLYIALISLVMPGFDVFQVVGLQALVYALAILSIYPYIKLAFFPGKKHAMLQSANPQ